MRRASVLAIVVANLSGCGLFEAIEDPVLVRPDASDDTADVSVLDASSDGDDSATDAEEAGEDVVDAEPDAEGGDAIEDASDDGVDAVVDAVDAIVDAVDAVGDAADADAVVCSASTYACSGAELRQCNATGTAWSTIVTCPSAATCDASKKRCTFCTPGTTCVGATLEKCDAFGATKTSETCATAELCAASGSGPCKTPACGVGEKRCAGKNVERCNAGRTGFEPDSTCAIGCAAGACLDVKQLSAGEGWACALMSDGTVRCWGNGTSGQLGLGSAITSTATPTTVPGLSGVAEVRAARHHTCARLSSGGVKCWGQNGQSQLGDGTKLDRFAPVDVLGVTTATAVAIGSSFSCVALADGTARCWGANAYGNLGDGTTTNRTSPTPVSSLSNVSQLRASWNGACAIKADGSVLCWGRYPGDGSFEQHAPVAVSLGSKAVELASGPTDMLVRLTDGTVKCWGFNSNGQCGDATTDIKPSPVTVTPAAGALELAMGGSFSCARFASTIRCWGANNFGQLGDGTTTPSTGGVTVLGLTSTRAIAAGYHFAIALLTTPEARAWGNNANGQLGIGAAGGSYNVPQKVVW